MPNDHLARCELRYSYPYPCQEELNRHPTVCYSMYNTNVYNTYTILNKYNASY